MVRSYDTLEDLYDLDEDEVEELLTKKPNRKKKQRQDKRQERVQVFLDEFDYLESEEETI